MTDGELKTENSKGKNMQVKYIGKKTISILFGGAVSLVSLAKEKPNIIWLMAEDIGPDIECYGMPAVRTPNLNRLAEEGIRFTNAFVTNPICSPSRSAMMTGVFQSKINAHHHRSNRQVPLQAPYAPFTKFLRENGYTCVLGNNLVMGSGRKTDVNFKSTNLGPWDGVESFGLFDKFDTFTKEDEPFFAQVQLNVTHRGDWWNRIREESAHPVNPDSVVLPPHYADHPVVRLDWARYLDQIEYMDAEVGTIIQDLKSKDLYDNTVIIFIGDNGRCNLRGKGYLFDPGLRVPFIMHWPEGLKGGQVRDDLVSTVDITATILDLAGVPIPAFMDAKSVLDNHYHRDYIYASRDLWDEVMEKSRTIITRKYKYIRHYMPEVPFDAGQAYLEFYRPALHVMRKLKWDGLLNEHQLFFFQSHKPVEELYDLETDPDELNNLAANAGYLEVLDKMREQLKQAEEFYRPLTNDYFPEVPVAVELLKWVRYHHLNDYLRMMQGEEIGFQKYSSEFRNRSGR